MNPQLSPAAQITPGYAAPPAPMGLADYGYGAAGPYAYNTSSFAATVALASPPNVTAPGSENVIDPQGSALGLVGSPYEFSLQLNTVGTNFAEPNTSTGVVWAQNVLDINDTAIHFVDDVWNLSADSYLQFAPNAIVSGCPGSNLSLLLAFERGVYQCVGGSLAISPADYPLEIELFNNVSVSPANQDVLTFGFAIWGDGRLLGAGDYDTLVFANPSGAAPAEPVAFTVNGFQRAPVQPAGVPVLLEDSEVTFGGPIGGANAVFRSLQGSLSLDYWTGATYTTIPSAYNFGSDTGETAIGISGYWNSTGVESINQGPSFLYGLWDTPSVLGVAAGAIQFQGSVNESYGFVFVSNVDPTVNQTNLSYVPTTVFGTFDSWLPPAVPELGGVYYTAAYAPGNGSVYGPEFSTNQTAYTFPVAPSSLPYIDAPLYMLGDAQAASLAYNLTGRPLTSTGPYVFEDLVVNLPIAFTHLNDYDFPSFVIVQAERLSVEIAVVNVTEGSNAFGGELYTLDHPLPPSVPGWITPGPAIVGPWKNFTEEFDLWDSYEPFVVDERLNGSLAFPNVTAGSGGVVFFFHDLDAFALGIGATNGSAGVANIESVATVGAALFAEYGARAFEDIGSYDTEVFGVSATESEGSNISIGVYALASHFGYFDQLASSDGAYAFYAGADTGYGAALSLLGTEGASIANVATYDEALGVALAYSYDTEVRYVSVGWASLGAFVDQSWFTTVFDLESDEGWGVDLVDSNYSALVNYTLYDFYDGSEWYGSDYTTVVNATFDVYYEAVYGFGDEYTSFTNLTVAYPYGPCLALEEMLGTSFANVRIENASEGNAGIVVAFSQDTAFSSLLVENVSADALGVIVAYATNTSLVDFAVRNVSDLGYGIYLEGTWNTTVSLGSVETVYDDAYGIYVLGASYTNVTGLSVRENDFGGIGAWVQGSNATAFVGLQVLFLGPDGAGVLVIGSNRTSFNETSIAYLTDGSLGIAVVGSNFTSFLDANVAFVEDRSTGIGLEADTATSFQTTFLEYIGSGGKGVWAAGATLRLSFNATDVFDSESGVVLDSAALTSFTSTYVVGSDTGVLVNSSSATQLRNVYVLGSDVGVAVNHSVNTTVATTYVDESYTGVYVNASVATTVTTLVANGTSDLGAFVTGSTGVTLSGLTANDTLGALVNGSSSIRVSGVGVVNGGLGLLLDNSTAAVVAGISVTGFSTGVVLDPSTAISVANVTVTDGGLGVVASASSDFTISNVSASYGSEAVALVADTQATISRVSATDGSVGVWTVTSRDLTVSGITATNSSFGFEAQTAYRTPTNHTSVSNVIASNASVGAIFFGGSHNAVTGVSATDHSVGVAFVGGGNDTASDVSVRDVSVGVGVLDAERVSVWDVTATNATTSDPWTGGYLAAFGVPAAAVLTMDDREQVNISAVSASHYPLALYDNGSEDLFVQGVNASFDAVGVMLNDTTYSLVSGLGAYADTVGLVASDDAAFNTVTGSHFVNDTGYGVDLLAPSHGNLVYDNDFVDDNGANNLTYQATHIQAYSWSAANSFNSSAKIGNYWADWHVYAGGVLAPYYVSNGAWDYHPLGAPEGKYLVTVTAVGLAPGTKWTVSLGGVSASSYADAIVFSEFPGTYAWQVSPIAGWSIVPSSGVLVVSNRSANITVDFAAEYQVTFAESGLPTLTSWSVVLNGVELSGSGSTIVFTEVAGTYAYTVLAPSGWLATPTTGSVSIAGAYLVPVSFTSTAVPMYNVWLNETGLSGAPPTWSATFNGVHQTASGASLVFVVPAGSYSFQVASVAGYTVSPSSGIVTVSGNDTIAIAFAPTSVPVTVQVHETGLPKGTSWSAHVGGILGTSSGNTLNVTVQAGGTYFYEIDPLAGYTVTHSSGTLYVGTTTYSVTVAFAPVTYTVTFGESGLSSGTVWSVVVDSHTYTGAGTTITVELTNGSHTYAFEAVSGYTVSTPSGSLTVQGSATGVSASYAPTSTPTYVAGSTFNTDLGIALAVAAVAVVLALVALLRRPRVPTPVPPATWQEGPPTSSGTTPGGDSSSPGSTKS